jgi:glycosyltransferase involved in cell wall biosynthesis
MKLSIVIPAYNEERLLQATLDAVRVAVGGLGGGITWEIIVCDNNSTDRTAEIATAAGVTVVREAVNQISRARNTGAKVATGDWLLFLDADSTPTPGLFADLAESMADPKICGGGATLTSDKSAPVIFRMFIGLWNALSRLKSEVAGSFFYARREAFESVGGFSEKLFAAEEIDLTKRLKRWGRPQGQYFRILHRYPLKTSARKAHLYTVKEFIRFAIRSACTGTRNLRSREECHIWYDGRR